MTTMLLICALMTAGLMKENQPVQRPVQVSFPSGRISVVTARREDSEPLRVTMYGIWQLEEGPDGVQAVSSGICDVGATLREGEELQKFHVSDTTAGYPSREVSVQARIAVRSESDYWGPESLGLHWELPQLPQESAGSEME